MFSKMNERMRNFMFDNQSDLSRQLTILYDCLNIQLLKDRQDQVDRDGLGLIGMHPLND